MTPAFQIRPDLLLESLSLREKSSFGYILKGAAVVGFTYGLRDLSHPFTHPYDFPPPAKKNNEGPRQV